MQYSFNQIASITGGNLHGEQTLFDKTLTHINFDSRNIVLPGESVFFAIKTSRSDGHNYINHALAQGVRYFCVENIPQTLKNHKDLVFIEVKSPVKALHLLAKHHRNRFKIPVVGITGSNGKTIVKEWLAQLLINEMHVVKSPLSFNSQLGVPLSVLNINHTHQIAIIEAGISQPGEMELLEPIIQPDICVFTHFGSAHANNFESDEEKLREKLQLCKGAQLLIAPKQDITYKTIKKFCSTTDCALVTWQTGHFKLGNYSINIDEECNTLSIAQSARGKASAEEEKFTFNLYGLNQAEKENSILALLTALYFTKKSETLQKYFSLLSPINMRLEVKKGHYNSLIINDTYNNDWEGLKTALQALKEKGIHPNKTIILSDFGDKTPVSKPIISALKGYILDLKADVIISVGKNMQQCDFSTATSQHLKFKTTEALIENWQNNWITDRDVLIKGNRKVAFEKIVSIVENTRHETRLEVNLSNITHNLNFFRSLLKKNVKLMAMVKAGAYGTGIVELARHLEYHKVDYMGVAFPDEGILLRKSGIQTPILIFNPGHNEWDVCAAYGLEVVVGSFFALAHIEKQSVHFQKPIKIHLEIDSGMHRLGFLPKNTHKLIQQLNRSKSIEVIGLMSHFAASDIPEQQKFIHQQKKVFEDFAIKLETAFGKNLQKHLANTNGILNYPEAQYDMVRLGIGLHGTGVNKKWKQALTPANRWLTGITQIKKIASGETVGYGRSEKLSKNTILGILPVGYADGFSRAFSNGKGQVWVNGQLANVVGKVCMDMTMIDLSGCNANEGDVVELFGENLHIETQAARINSIPYELLAGISSRVKKVYIQN